MTKQFQEVCDTYREAKDIKELVEARLRAKFVIERIKKEDHGNYKVLEKTFDYYRKVKQGKITITKSAGMPAKPLRQSKLL
ncbi:MAG TPA: hypothetical protein ENH85_00840 [Candidatus Scalindua sp.]|nr:hypothetical protein [Candidatus Scalindua sp.]